MTHLQITITFPINIISIELLRAPNLLQHTKTQYPISSPLTQILTESHSSKHASKSLKKPHPSYTTPTPSHSTINNIKIPSSIYRARISNYPCAIAWACIIFSNGLGWRIGCCCDMLGWILRMFSSLGYVPIFEEVFFRFGCAIRS